ncbi:MAG: Crp/Fnr family transcriptional regulator [Cyclobacteriaceae bacterium]
MEEELIKQCLSEISDHKLIKAISTHGIAHNYSSGETIIEPGKYIKMVPIVMEGGIKVMRTNEEGHELFLYYLGPGETCAVALTCCSKHKTSEIKAVAEENTLILGIPVTLHETWTNEFRQWKEYVSQTYQHRFQELLHTIDEIAFKKMDERLMKYILTKVRQLKTNEIQITHQEIATELSTSREVVSRLLKQLEKRKLIELGRNRIYVHDDFEEIISH